MTSAASVKERLKNKARSTGKTMQELLTLYGLERTIYRLSISRHASKFTLKGGVLLYALSSGNFARVTKDIDLLATGVPNATEILKNIFADVFRLSYDDALRFDLSSLEAKDITEFKDYHGVNISIDAFLDKTRIRVSIDIGFGDSVYPKATQLEFPVLLDMAAPIIHTYPIASVIAEKFEAMVFLGDANSRYKDFYDIYMIAQNHDISGKVLSEAIKRTFSHRKTSLDGDILAFSDTFPVSPIHQTRWKAFQKKKRIGTNMDFPTMMVHIQNFLLPIVNCLKEKKEFQKKWNSRKQNWE